MFGWSFSSEPSWCLDGASDLSSAGVWMEKPVNRTAALDRPVSSACAALQTPQVAGGLVSW